MSSSVLENLTLDELIRKMYDNMVKNLIRKNNLTERKYFKEKRKKIPFGDIINDASYYEHFEQMKVKIKEPNITEEQIQTIFEIMESLFLFSLGYDIMFKHKLKGDIFHAAPIESIIYPRLLKTIKSKFNDVSVMTENPKLEENISEIRRIIFNYQELSTLLFMLYTNEWKFPEEWEQCFPESYDFLLKELQETDLTIGIFLDELVEYKCKMMEEVLQCIPILMLREKYLNKLTTLKQERKKEIESHAFKGLSVAYFLDYTVDDFMTSASIIPSSKKRIPFDNKKIISFN